MLDSEIEVYIAEQAGVDDVLELVYMRLELCSQVGNSELEIYPKTILRDRGCRRAGVPQLIIAHGK